MSKTLILLGLIILFAGIFGPILQKINLGHLPGDILIKREGFRFYFPITTSILISVILTQYCPVRNLHVIILVVYDTLA